MPAFRGKKPPALKLRKTSRPPGRRISPQVPSRSSPPFDRSLHRQRLAKARRLIAPARGGRPYLSRRGMLWGAYAHRCQPGQWASVDTKAGPSLALGQDAAACLPLKPNSWRRSDPMQVAHRRQGLLAIVAGRLGQRDRRHAISPRGRGTRGARRCLHATRLHNRGEPVRRWPRPSRRACALHEASVRSHRTCGLDPTPALTPT